MTISPTALEGFDRDTFTFDGKTREIFRVGSGPAVIVISEMPGITPKVLAFARRVAAIGCTATLPHLFGTPGREGMEAGNVPMVTYTLSSMVPTCISKDFVALASGKTAPVIDWLRALGRHEHERCGGPGIGAIGMCFTGGFALAMATDDRLLAPVLSQPSLPFPVSKSKRRAIDCSDADLATVKQRCAADGLKVLGMRFTNDRFVPKERFEFLREQLGSGFIGVEIDSSPGNLHEVPSVAHSVVTEHLVDQPGHPTRDALDRVLDLFRDRLLSRPA